MEKKTLLDESIRKSNKWTIWLFAINKKWIMAKRLKGQLVHVYERRVWKKREKNKQCFWKGKSKTK